MTRSLLLIDGHSSFYRAVFSPGPRLTSPSGEPTNGTYIYMRLLLALLRERRPTHVAVAIDGSRGALVRRMMWKGYKATRVHRPDDGLEVQTQLRRMVELTRLLGLTIISSPGWEADDVLATLVRRFHRLVDRTEVVTRDRDLHQLVSDRKRVNLYDPQGDVVTREADVEKQWGVPVSQVVEVKTLFGDRGDGVPGVGGIGIKTATALIQRFGTVEQTQASASLLPKAVGRAILRADLKWCRALVALNADAPLHPEPDDVEALAFTGPNLQAAAPLFKILGFRRSAAE